MRRRVSGILVPSREVSPSAPSIGSLSVVSPTTFSYAGFNWAGVYKSASSAYALQRSGNVWRAEVRSGDWADVDNPNNPGQERAELDHVGTLLQPNVTNITYLQMIPTGDAITLPTGSIVGQLHHYADAGDASSPPPLAIYVGAGDTLWVKIRYYTVKPMVSNPPSILIPIGRFQRNRWYSWRWRYRYDPTSTGFLQVFRDEVPLVSYQGPFGFVNLLGPTPQFGIYRANSPEILIVYYANIAIAYE